MNGRRLTTLGVSALALLGALALGAAPASAAPIHPASHAAGWQLTDEGDDGLVVKVVDPTTPTPAPTPTPTPTPVAPTPQSPRPASGSGPLPQVVQQPLTDTAAADAALGPQSESMAGLIYVSAARTAPRFSLHPDGGEVAIVLSLRNVASETVDGTARFWITTAWGWGASEPVEVEVTALAPGETRELTATLPGPGQWAFYQAHAEYTPPATVDGVDLAAITRTEFLFILPLFALGVAGVAGIVVGAYVWGSRVLARREGLGE